MGNGVNGKRDVAASSAWFKHAGKPCKDSKGTESEYNWVNTRAK